MKTNSKGNVEVSVIMPARNVERYVQEAVESVLRQQGVSFELLLVDDASTDETWRKIQPYRSDPRVRLWRSRRRQGAAGARNLLLRFARGRYVVPCDADDKILPGYLKSLVTAIRKHPSAGVVFFSWFLEQRGKRIITSRKVLGPDRAWDLLGYESIGHPGTLIRRSMMEQVRGYDVKLPFLHDYDLFLRLAEVTRFLCLKGKPLFFHRRRRGTISDCTSRDYKRVFQTVLRKAILRRYHIRVPW